MTREPTDKAELDNLHSIVKRCLSDLNAHGLSDEQRFIIAYDAARTLSLMIVRSCGYRPKKLGGHYNTFIALEAANSKFATISGYFNTCRMKRNDSEYDFAGSITSDDTKEIIDASQAVSYGGRGVDSKALFHLGVTVLPGPLLRRLMRQHPVSLRIQDNAPAKRAGRSRTQHIGRAHGGVASQRNE